MGRRFASGLSLEAEISYRKNDYDDIKATGTTTVSGVTITGTNVPVALNGDVTSLGAMANIAFDFNKDGQFHPFVLGGLGGARVSINDASVSGVLLADDSDFVLAFQAGAGISYDLNDSTSVSLSYRYFRTSNPDFTGSDGSTTFDMEYQSHSALAGLTFKF